MTEIPRRTVFLGADPGQLGAIALVNWPHYARAIPLRNRADDEIFALIGELVEQYEIRFAFIERVRPLPFHMRGPIGSVKLAQSYGALKMALTGRAIDFEEKDPAYWQRRMGCLTGGDKRITLERARELFPGLKITHQTADALLIARLCQLHGRSPDLLFRGQRIKRPTSWRKLRI